jgi:hypothetical protein
MPTDSPENQRTVAELVGPDCFVTPAINSWVSLYSEFEDFGNTTDATALSQQLSLPVIDMWIYDSEAAGATLIVNGVEKATVEIMLHSSVGNSPLDEFNAASGSDESVEDVSEMTGMTIEELLAVPNRIPMFGDISDGAYFVEGSAADWIATFVGATEQDLRNATQFTSVDEVLTEFVNHFGIPANRTILAHRWIDQTNNEDHATFIPGTATN